MMQKSSISRRTILSGIAPALLPGAMRNTSNVERWGMWEQAFSGAQKSEAEFRAEFRNGNRVLLADGFYDGNGVYRLRFMPDALGEWTFTTHSTVAALNGKTGKFLCTAPSSGNHGPVVVADPQHFRYADGTPHLSIGTTCYAWAHQADELERQTLETLKTSPFNKIRSASTSNAQRAAICLSRF